MSELFVKATREKFRFPSIRGELTTEQLWELPLTSRNGFNLNAVAIEVNNGIKSYQEDSFVETTVNPELGLLRDKLEVIKFVIAVRKEDAARREQRQKLQAQRDKLREAIETKRNEALYSSSLEELEAQLAALGEG